VWSSSPARAAGGTMRKPQLTRRQQRAWRKLLRPLLRVPYEEPLCQVPRPRGVVVRVVLAWPVTVKPRL